MYFTTSRDLAEDGAPLKFLEYAKDISKLLSLSQCRKIPQRIRIRLGNRILPNWKQKNRFSENDFLEKSSVPKKELLARNTTFSQDKVRYESGRVPFDQVKVSEKTHRAEKSFKV